MESPSRPQHPGRVGIEASASKQDGTSDYSPEPEEWGAAKGCTPRGYGSSAGGKPERSEHKSAAGRKKASGGEKRESSSLGVVSGSKIYRKTAAPILTRGFR